MLFLSIYTPAGDMSGPPSPEHMAEMGALVEKMTKAGVLVSTGPLGGASQALRIARSGNAFDVKDGLDASGLKEGGYGLLECRSKEHLIEVAKEFLEIAGDGECIIRPVTMA